MAVPFSNTKLRVPAGFQSLLAGLSIEVLRSQPRNIHSFAAEYFEKLVQRREQGHTNAGDRQVSHDDRYYNNRSFQEQYPVNDRHVDEAATRIQAQFRGHKTRHDLERGKENKHSDDDDDEQEHRYGQATNKTSGEKSITADDHHQETSNGTSRRETSPLLKNNQMHGDHQHFQSSPREQTHATGSIEKHETKQKSPSPTGSEEHPHASDAQGFHENYLRSSPGISPHSSKDMGSPRQDLHDGANEYLEDEEPLEQRFIEEDQLDEEHQDPSYEEEEPETHFDDQDDMNDSNLDKAATRIQASYRGYKTRKELGSIGNHPNSSDHPVDHRPPSISSQMAENYDTPRNKKMSSPTIDGNDGPAHEHDDNAAAIKIQAAYRGYRVRRDLDK